MTEKNQNVEIWQGDTKDLVFTVTGVTTLSGASGQWSIADTKDGEAHLVKDSSATVVISGLEVAVKLVPSDTTELEPRNYYHELKITDASANIHTGAVGQFRLRPRIDTT